MGVKVGVLGGGSWGTALSILLAKKGIDIDLWVRDHKKAESMKYTKENTKYLSGIVIPNNVHISSDLYETVIHKDIIVLAVPSHAVRSIIQDIKEHIKPGQVLVNVAKGLENTTLCRISEIVEAELPQAEYAILSGPSHAEEVARDMPTTIVAAAKKKDVAEYVQDVFITPKFRVYTNPDIIGVELGGALKNVIALGAGISDGLGYGDNTKAALMNRGIIEIARLGEHIGANRMTFAGLTGIGDLIVTCTSMHSRNRRAGILIGEGLSPEEAIGSIGMVVEGIKTSKAAYELSRKYNVKMPITEEIYNVLYQGKDVKNAVINLMLRDKKHEMEEIVESDNNLW